MKKYSRNQITNTIAIVIPTFNEKENIINLITKVQSCVGNCSIYVVDDNSPDGTKELVRAFNQGPGDKVLLMVRTTKSGRGGAVLSGMREALKNPRIQHFIEMDADFSHDPAVIPKLLATCTPNTVSVASRYIKGGRILNWTLKRKVTSRLANAYIRWLLRVPINDCTNGFRCYPRRAAMLIAKSNVRHKGFITLSETLYILFKKGFEFVEVPFNFVDRKMGVSNASIGEALSSLTAIIDIKRRYHN